MDAQPYESQVRIDRALGGDRRSELIEEYRRAKQQELAVFCEMRGYDVVVPGSWWQSLDFPEGPYDTYLFKAVIVPSKEKNDGAE